MKKGSCSSCIYDLSYISHGIESGPSRTQWDLHAACMLPLHLCSGILSIYLEILWNLTPAVFQPPWWMTFQTFPLQPFTSISGQQVPQMVYFEQIYQCRRLHLVEESVNWLFLIIITFFIVNFPFLIIIIFLLVD